MDLGSALYGQFPGGFTDPTRRPQITPAPQAPSRATRDPFGLGGTGVGGVLRAPTSGGGGAVAARSDPFMRGNQPAGPTQTHTTSPTFAPSTAGQSYSLQNPGMPTTQSMPGSVGGDYSPTPPAAAVEPAGAPSIQALQSRGPQMPEMTERPAPGANPLLGQRNLPMSMRVLIGRQY